MRNHSPLVRVVALLLIVTYPATSFAFFSLPAAVTMASQYPPPRVTRDPPAAEVRPDSTATEAPAVSTAGDCNASHSRGHRDASAKHSSTKWFFGGVCSGVLLGLIGTTVITIGAATTDPFPKEVPTNVETACYVKGYEGKGKSKNTWSALEGGILGSLAFLAVYWMASD